MMKKLIVLAVVVMVFGMVSGAYADATQWLLYLKCSDIDGASGITTTFNYGLKSGAADGQESNDASNTAGTGSAVVLGCFDLGTGAANNGFYKDLRAPGTNQLTWNLKIWVQPGYNMKTIKLTGWNPTGTYDMVAPTMKITDGTRTFVFDPAANGTSTAPQFTWTFDPVGHVGVENAYTLQFTPVPEPGSMLAILTGLVGLVGIRRRK